MTELPRESNVKEIARVDLGVGVGSNAYHLRVTSDCGVVKLYSSRDGCIVAMSPERARTVAEELRQAIWEAALSVESASAGGRR